MAAKRTFPDPERCTGRNKTRLREYRETHPGVKDEDIPLEAVRCEMRALPGSDPRRCTRWHGAGTQLSRAKADRNVKVAAARQLLGYYGVVADVELVPVVDVGIKLQIQAAKMLYTQDWLESEVSSHDPASTTPSIWIGILNEHRKETSKLLLEMKKLGIEEDRATFDRAQAVAHLDFMRRFLARMDLTQEQMLRVPSVIRAIGEEMQAIEA